jgi:predicted small lipoprotein YifL
MKALLALALLLGLSSCPGPKGPVDYQDDPETPIEAKAGTACQRAARRLELLKCKEAAPDFAEQCQKLVDQKLPVCPTKIAKIKTCGEVETVCR